MPIYEYRCLDCGHQFELMQKFSDPPAEACTSCAGTVQKLISRSAFHLKGSGWYVTDYGRNGGANGKTAEKGEANTGDTKSTSDSSSSGNSETASAASASSDSSTSATASPSSSSSAA